MITQTRATELDFYFTFDHRARAKTTIALIVTGTGIAIACHSCGLRDVTTGVASTAAVALGLLIRLATYRLDKRVRKFAKKGQQPIDLGKRNILLAQVPALLLTLCGFLFFPSGSEGDIVDARLKQLVKAGRKTDAQKFARAASASGIPLRPQTALLASHAEEINPSLSPPLIGPQTDASLVAVGLETGDRIRIWPRYLYLPNGRYLITRTLYPGWASWEGQGQEMAGLEFAATTSDPERRVPLFRFIDDMRADTLIYNMFVAGLSHYGLTFIDSQQASRNIAVVDVHISNLGQTLDRIIWIDTRFEDCAIQCGGRGFKLHNVVFDNCQFLPSPAVPEDLIRRIADSNGESVTLSFGM